MGSLREFVADVLESEGAAVEPIEPDELEVLAPEPLCRAMGWPELVRLGFGPTPSAGVAPIRLEGDWSGSILRSAALSLAVLAGLWLWGGQAEAFGRDLSSLLSTWPGGAGAVGGAAALAGLAALVLLGARGDRSAWLGLAFLVCYTIYGAKVGPGAEFWPFRGWGHDALSLAGGSRAEGQK